MKSVLAILGGLGVGVAVMYMFDPEKGNRRRALIRDKAVKINRKTREALDARVHDIGNRTKGLLHEAKSVFAREQESSEQKYL